MPAPQFVPLSLDEFRKLVDRFDFSARKITEVHMHHTWRPRQVDFKGLASIVAMWQFHTQTNKWSDIAQHVTIDPQGVIWTGRSWKQPPASSGGRNGTSRAGPFMFEMIGDFDKGKESLTGKQLEAVIGVITAIQKRNGLAPESLKFHNQLGSPKTCPGSGIRYEDILAQVKTAHLATTSTTRSIAKSKKPEATSAFVKDESRIADALQVLASATRATEEPLAGMEQMEGEPDFEAEQARGAGLVERPAGARAVRDTLDAAGFARLRPHVINLVQGDFVPSGIYQTSKADVGAIFTEHLARRVASATAEKPLRVMLWAHGGLVSERNGLRGAARMLDWWLQNGVYPLHFIWETGAMETIAQLVTGAGARAPAVGARDLWDHSTDPLIERLTRPLGMPLWSGMKRSAERASAPGGGAHLVAEHLAKFVKANKHVEVHAAGHSAGSIFHSHLLPTLVAKGVTVKTLSLLAPAVRVDTFVDQLLPLVGPKKGIQELALFTMAQDWEKRDQCANLYRKSLLYLVSLAFEPGGKTPILGLEECLRADDDCRALFGIGSGSGVAEVIWSKSVPTMGRHSSRATSHGEFDEDPATMNSVVRRVLGKDDVADIHGMPEPDGSRTVSTDDDDMPAELALFMRPDIQASSVAPATSGAYRKKPTVTGAAGGRRFALLVGINNYPTAPLEACVSDTERWAAALGKLGFAETTRLINDEATRAKILEALRKMVREAESGDVMVFQFAGHGTQLPDLDGDEDGDGQDEALCPYDFDTGNFLIDDDIKEVFAGLPAGVNLTCFIDCCHSGTITRFAVAQSGRVMGVRGGVPKARFIRVKEPVIEKYRKARAKSATRALKRVVSGSSTMHEVVFSACRPDQVAFESGGQGDFTRIATELLENGLRNDSHADFIERVRREFGANPRQEPQLDCAPKLRDALLLDLAESEE